MMRGRRERDHRWLPDTAIREQRDRRSNGRLTPSPQEEIDWVRRQIDGTKIDIPDRERLAFRRSELKRLKANREWTERKDKTRRKFRKAEEEQELSSVRTLSPAPQTFAHVDLPTGKRIYVPLEPGQDASSLKNCSLEAINATRRTGGVKAASDAAKAAEAARRKRAAQMRMKAAVRMGVVGGPARPRSLPALLAPGATGHELGCECALCQRFQDNKMCEEAERAYDHQDTPMLMAVVAADSNGRRHAEHSTPVEVTLSELITESIDAAISDVCRSSDERELRQIFERADRNSDGKLTRAELILRLKKDAQLADLLHLPTRVGDGDRDAFERVFQGMDADDSRGVDVEEFVTHLSKVVSLGSAAATLGHSSQLQSPVLKLTDGEGSHAPPLGGDGRKVVQILGTTNEITP